MDQDGDDRKPNAAYIFDADKLGFAIAVLAATCIIGIGFYQEISLYQIAIRAGLVAAVTYVVVFMLVNFALNTALGEAMERRRALAEKVMAGVSVPEGVTHGHDSIPQEQKGEEL